MKEGKAFQYCSTWRKKGLRDFHPKCEFVMHMYDEVKVKTRNAKNDVFQRKEPYNFFLLPEHLSESEYGERLERVAIEMKKGSGKGYECTRNCESFVNLVFGKKDICCCVVGCGKLAWNGNKRETHDSIIQSI